MRENKLNSRHVFSLITLERSHQQPKGPFKYYVSKKVGGWGMPNAYVFLHGGWVGLARCLRNKRNEKIKKILLLNFPETKNYNTYISFYSRYI